MYDGALEYRGHIANLEFGPLEIRGDRPSVEKIVLASSQVGDLTIRIHVTKVNSLSEARAFSDAIATRITDTLAFDRGKYVSEPDFFSHTLTRDVVAPDGTTHKEEIMSQGPTVSDKAAATVKAGPNTENDMRTALESQGQPGAHYYGIFRSALSNGDPVSKFLALYNILLLLNDDLQENVDKFVRKAQPSVPETPSPRRKGVMETIYTRLRNEFGHNRCGTTFEGTRAEMEANLDKLVEVVKERIRQQS